MSDSNELKRLQLEVGGSFFELIEFTLTRKVNGKAVRGIYGVNVAKVREVVRLPNINPLSSRVKGIAGVFELRGIPIPAVDLAMALGDDETDASQRQQIIVTEFSQKRAGFIVEATRRIRRIAWDKVLPPTADAGTCINGMTLIEKNEFLFILDLEKILLNLEGFNPSPFATTAFQTVDNHGGSRNQAAYVPAREVPPPNPNAPGILLVDDSQMIRNGVKIALQRVGYRVVEATDGAEAFAVLERVGRSGRDKIDIVVTDVEMPRMDGLSFTKKVREHPTLGDIPIILHTSLSGKANQEAGHSVGANGYVIKNDLRCLFELLREIIGHDPASAASA